MKFTLLLPLLMLLISLSTTTVMAATDSSPVIEEEFSLDDLDLEETEDTHLPKRKHYWLIPIALLSIAGYITTDRLSKFKKMKLATHKKIWNVILLFSFIFSGVSGILLIFMVNWGINLPIPINMLYWHVETGTVFFMASAFHTHWHWKYYESMLKQKRKRKKK